MKNLIHNLRQKPKEDRIAIAGSMAGGVIAVLLCGWGVVTLYTFDSKPAISQSASAASATAATNANTFKSIDTPVGYNTPYATSSTATSSSLSAPSSNSQY